MRDYKNTQKHYILNHLQRYGFINPMIALREFGCFRLSARIKDLRDEGYNILMERTEGVSAITGNRVSYATYRLVKQ